MPASPQPETKRTDTTTGVVFALSGYGWWAVITPLYFYVLSSVPALELLAWRVITGAPTLILLLWLMKRQSEIWTAMRNRRVLGTLIASSLLLSANWFTFVWAVITDRLAEASLGSVFLGMIFLGERLRGFQIFAICIAASGVGVMAIVLGDVPWISLVLAGSFGCYGLLRKTVDAGPASGLAVESIILFPLMVILLGFVHFDTGLGAFSGPWWLTTLLMLGGIQTVVPLLFYIGAAKRLRLSTVGLLQYTAPTGQLLLAVLFLDEPFGTGRAIAFGLIWVAVVIYSIDSFRRARRERLVTAANSNLG
jgi:chloramphenicol-sensitive protein RarD